MLAPELGEVKLASCQLELPPKQGPKKDQLELDLELTRVSKVDENR